jgi:hypothetical protein
VMPSRVLGGEALGLLCRRRERPQGEVGAATVHLQGGKKSAGGFRKSRQATHVFGKSRDGERRRDVTSIVEDLKLGEGRRVGGVQVLLLRRVRLEGRWCWWVERRRSGLMRDVDDLVAQELGRAGADVEGRETAERALVDRGHHWVVEQSVGCVHLRVMTISERHKLCATKHSRAFARREEPAPLPLRAQRYCLRREGAATQVLGGGCRNADTSAFAPSWRAKRPTHWKPWPGM